MEKIAIIGSGSWGTPYQAQGSRRGMESPRGHEHHRSSASHADGLQERCHCP